jgi:dihydropteroate synthase
MPLFSLRMKEQTVTSDRPWVMGIVNVTPDSFSDSGQFFNPQKALSRALALVDDGADMIDIGGESSRPGAAAVADDEELKRILPLTEALAQRSILVSVDTVKPQVMRAAISAGAAMINDINALCTPDALEAVAASQAAVCLMHMQGEPRTMQEAPHYENVVEDVIAFLKERIDACVAAGITRERIVLDPGFGFGKTVEHNLELMRNLPKLRTLGLPLLIGWSRKSTLGALTGRAVDERLPASLAAALAAAAQGAAIIRVHDVRETVDALTIWRAMTPETT